MFNVCDWGNGRQEDTYRSATSCCLKNEPLTLVLISPTLHLSLPPILSNALIVTTNYKNITNVDLHLHRSLLRVRPWLTPLIAQVQDMRQRVGLVVPLSNESQSYTSSLILSQVRQDRQRGQVHRPLGII